MCVRERERDREREKQRQRETETDRQTDGRKGRTETETAMSCKLSYIFAIICQYFDYKVSLPPPPPPPSKIVFSLNCSIIIVFLLTHV